MSKKSFLLKEVAAMKISPNLSEAKKIAGEGKYKVLPVSCEILSDICTPIEAVKILKNVSTHCYMLESAAGKEKWGRYTFLGFDPKLEITCMNGEMKIGNIKFKTDDPSAFLRQILEDYKSPRFEGLPSFTGGLVGYFSYDYLGYREPAVRTKVQDTEAFKDVDLMLFDKVIAFDNFRQKIILIVNIPLQDIEVGYNRAVMELKQLCELLRTGEKKTEPGGRLLGDVTPLFNKEQYCGMVEKAKHYICEGDIFQIVLSNRLSAPFSGSLLNTYRVLRTINPSPYMFYFSGTDVEVAGASPETLVKLENGVLHTFPLAGTKPRGKTEKEDKALEAALLNDEKELAEHNMLVDLGRNDLGKISKFGTVQVEKLHSVERYSHVMHIGSTVRGEIQEAFDALDAIEAVLPAGTLSGAPKIRACQLIGELEQNKRGIYGGAIGYIDFTGNMDTCIAIRIAYKKNGKVFIRSGAGIVSDSVPEKEFEECINKAKAVVNALKLAEEVDA
jgi:anthranilate synthase component 1